MDLRGLALVAAGGALGALARLGVSLALYRPTFPWATLAINLAGSFLLGALLLGLPSASVGVRQLLAVGFLGAFTTLSTYSVETLTLWRGGHPGLAGLNVAANGLGGPVAALVGWRAAVLLG